MWRFADLTPVLAVALLCLGAAQPATFDAEDARLKQGRVYSKVTQGFSPARGQT